MKKLFMLIIAATISATLLAQKQSVLDNLTFPTYKKFMRAKSGVANVRTAPSLKAARVKDEWGRFEQIPYWRLFPVLEENAGWFRIPYGWVSKTVAQESVCQPITPSMLEKNQAGGNIGYDWIVSYRIASPVGAHGLALLLMDQDGFLSLRLGKQVGNIFVFKYVTFVKINMNESQPNLFEILKDEDNPGSDMWNINVGINYCVKLNTPPNTGYEAPWGIDLSRFSDEQIEKVFKSSIRNKEIYYMYFNSDVLTGKFANFFMQ